MLKKFVFIILTLLISTSATGEDANSAQLFIIHFETGPQWNESLQPQEQTQFREHSTNLNRLRKEKVIVFGARYSDLGLIIVTAESLSVARSIIEKDPGVQSGIFDFRIEPLNVFYPWEM
jgi:uncharacterized protein YciI